MANPELAEFFRQNTADLPMVAKQWFELPGYQQGKRRLLGLNFAVINLPPMARDLIQECNFWVDVCVARSEYQLAISMANQALGMAETDYNGTESRSLMARLYEMRGSTAGNLFTYTNRPVVLLSAVADYMRSDTKYGVITSAQVIGLAFQALRMGRLQLEVIRHQMGSEAASVVKNGLTPSNPDMIQMQHAILYSLPGANLNNKVRVC